MFECLTNSIRLRVNSYGLSDVRVAQRALVGVVDEALGAVQAEHVVSAR